MAKFQYSGRDGLGALVSGNIDAGTADDAASQLCAGNVTPIEIREMRGRQAAGDEQRGEARINVDANASVIERAKVFLSGSKVELDDLIMFSRQMFSLTKAGIPLDKAIKGLEASHSNALFKVVLRDVLTGLESGMSLSAAMGRRPKIFSQLFLSLVHVGENTGRLDLAFQEVGKYLSLEKNTRKQVKSATRYPIFVMMALVAALGVITVFIIPVFSSTFARLGADLPWQTVVLINTSDFVVNYWPLIVGIIGGSIFGFLYWSNTDQGRLSWDQRKLKIPLAGAVFERVALARFSRTFSMVMGAGLPIVQGLNVVASAVGNTYIGSNVHKMREGVERGESLYRSAANSKMFSPLVLQMISVGEETGTVDELLGEAADFYDAEVEYDLKRLSEAIEPILIVFIGALVLILALGVFLPIWEFNTALQR